MLARSGFLHVERMAYILSYTDNKKYMRLLKTGPPPLLLSLAPAVARVQAQESTGIGAW